MRQQVPDAVTTQDGSTADEKTPRRISRPLLAAAGAVVFVLLVALLTLGSRHMVQGTSDNATVLLEGQAMAHGNLLLHHWLLSLDSFWTVDVPFYAVADIVLGLRPGALFVVPAVLAALVVVVGVAMVVEGAHRRVIGSIAGAAVVVAVLAFPSYTMAQFYLSGPLHTGTALYALVAFWCLRRNRFGLGWIVAVVLLGAALYGDLQIVAYGTLPVVGGGVVAIIRRRSFRAGVVPLSAAAASAVFGVVLRHLALLIGSFHIGKANPTASNGERIADLRHLPSVLAQLVGVHQTDYGPGGAAPWADRIHWVILLGLIACLVITLVGMVVGMVRGRPRLSGAAESARPAGLGAATGDDAGDAAGTGTGGTSLIGRLRHPGRTRTIDAWRLDDMLAIAVFGPAGAYVDLTTIITNAYDRYAMVSVIFAAILAGRVVARILAHRRVPQPPAALVALVGVVVLCIAAVSFSGSLRGREPQRTAVPLAAWLEAHHLTRGVGDYWSSSITTVYSRGQVVVRPVQALDHGVGSTLGAYNKGPITTWFDGQTFQFLVYLPPDGFGDVDTKTAEATWGAAKSYQVAGYVVLVWSHPISVDVPAADP